MTTEHARSDLGGAHGCMRLWVAVAAKPHAARDARCLRLRRRHVSAAVHEKKAADARALPMEGPDHVSCYTHVCPAADCDREGHSIEAVKAGARSSKRLRATGRPGLPRPGRRVDVFACAEHPTPHTSMIHPQHQQNERSRMHVTHRVRTGNEGSVNRQWERATRLLQHVH